LIDTGMDKRYARHNAKGEFSESGDAAKRGEATAATGKGKRTEPHRELRGVG
jgi:hypothetical protein